jgi:4-carboxymuconolactone decarboxylase
MRRFIKTAIIAAAVALPLFSVAQTPMQYGSPRYPVINPANFTPQQKQFADEMKKPPRNGDVNNPGPFRVYFRSPEFGMHAIAMSDYLRWGTGIDPRLLELAIIIAARNWNSAYIWRAHYPDAVQAGLDPSVGADIAAGRRPTKMKDDEALVYDFLTQMYRDKEITDATFNAMKAKFGEKGVTEIMGIAGYYGITAMALITAKQPVPPGDEPKLATLTQVFPK